VPLPCGSRSPHVEPLERRATQAGTGQWVIENLPVPLPGRWQVRVDVLVSDFEKTTLGGQVEVRSAGPRADVSAPPEADGCEAIS
jgi:hypothetical protein